MKLIWTHLIHRIKRGVLQRQRVWCSRTIREELKMRGAWLADSQLRYKLQKFTEEVKTFHHGTKTPKYFTKTSKHFTMAGVGHNFDWEQRWLWLGMGQVRKYVSLAIKGVLGAIASPSISLSVGQWVIDSFRLEIAIASPSLFLCMLTNKNLNTKKLSWVLPQ